MALCAPAAVAVCALIAAGACSTPAKLVAQGGECHQATDCEEGLVCIPQQDGKSICDSDLSKIQKTEDAAPPPVHDAGTPRDGASDAPVARDGGGGTDAAPPDDGAAGVDSSSPPDAGSD